MKTFPHDNPNLNQLLTDLSPNLIYIMDVINQQFTYINPRIQDILGYTYDDLKEAGNNWAPKILELPDGKSGVWSHYAKIRGNATVKYKVKVLHKNGSVKYLKTQETILKWDKDGHPSEVLGIAEDITIQQNLSEELARSKHSFGLLEEMLQCGSWEYDLIDHYLTCSNGTKRLFGYETGELPEKIPTSFFKAHFHQDDLDIAEEIEQKIISLEGINEHYNWRIIAKDGQMKYLEGKGMLLPDKKGNYTKLLAATADITILKTYEAKLEQKINDLKKSNQNLEQFAYIASHDLQEPLRKISAFGERLSKKYSGQLGEEGLLYLNRMTDASVRMKLLIDNLLSYSRTTRKVDDFKETNLNLILKDVLNDLELKIEDKNVGIISGNLPTLEAIPSQMNQLFMNLISNAIKFSKTEERPSIEITAKTPSPEELSAHNLLEINEYIRISIKDNGMGFEMEFAEKIFEIFQRLHGRSAFEGSGIGLAICKKIAENHEGVIFARSEPEVGTEFVIILPRKQLS